MREYLWHCAILGAMRGGSIKLLQTGPDSPVLSIKRIERLRQNLEDLDLDADSDEVWWCMICDVLKYGVCMMWLMQIDASYVPLDNSYVHLDTSYVHLDT